MSFLSKIRSTKARMPLGKMALNTAAVLLLGIALGVFSKYLDYRQASLPQFLMLIDEALDLHNFLGRFPFWVGAALCISVYSNSSVRAAVNVFAFFAGMVSSYYVYSKYVAGFFPKSYAMIWVAFTIISPLLAFICWYSKGSTKVSIVLSSMIFAVMFNMTFAYGWLYFGVYSVFGADNLCFQRDYFIARSNKGNRAHDSLGHCHCAHIEGCNALSPRVMHGDSQASDRRSNVNGKQKGAADFAAPYLINL